MIHVCPSHNAELRCRRVKKRDSLTQEETEEIHPDQQLSPAVVFAVVVVVVVRDPAVPRLGCHTFLINQTALHLNRLAWFGCAAGIEID